MKQRVTFASEGLSLVGNLFLPENSSADTRLPAVLVTGSWTTVKEQMPNLYAQHLADRGFVALTFDFRHYGESEGQPRTYESPERKIMDITNALTFLQTVPQVDAERIYGLGICASAGYMARAASEDPRIKKLALVAPWLHNGNIVKLIYGGEEGVAARIGKAKAAKKKYAETGISDMVPACSATDPEAAMYGNWDYYLNPQRGTIPEWTNAFALMAWDEWLEFDPISIAGKISVPTLLVHSPDAAVPMGAEQFYGQMTARKHFHWTTGTQFDFYDQPDKVQESVEKAVEWLNEVRNQEEGIRETGGKAAIVGS